MSEVMTHAVGERGEITVRARAGQVRIRGIEGAVARVRSQHAGDLRKVVVETAPAALVVRTHDDDPLDIEVPVAATVRVEAGSADLEARDLRGVQHYRTASGDIRGQGLTGDVTIDAVSGDVELSLDGPSRVQARTVSGDLAVRAGDLSLFRGATTSGDLRVAARFDGDGPFTVETVSGDAIVAPAGPLRIETSTITGDIRSEVDASSAGAPGRRTLTIGTGGPTLSFRSTSGDLRVVRAVEQQEATASAASDGAPTAPGQETHADPRLDVLRSLESGDIDVAEATDRLAAIDAQEARRA